MAKGAEVRALKPAETDHGEMPPVTPGVAVGTSMKFDLGMGRDIVLQTHLDRDAPIEQWHDILDKVREAGERQASQYMLRSAKANLKMQQRELQTAKDRLPIAEKQHEEDRAKRNEAIASLRAQHLSFNAECAREWAVKGRRGKWTPSTAETSRANGFLNQITAIEEDQKKADVERENAIKASTAEQISYEKNLEFYASEVAELEARLKE